MYKFGKADGTADGVSTVNLSDNGKAQERSAAKSAKRGRQGELTAPTLLDAIYQAVQERPNIRSAALYQEMLGDRDLAPLLPNARAFRGHVAAIRDQIDNDRWEPARMDPDDARLVLEVVGRMRQVQAPYEARQRELLLDESSDPRGRRILAEQMARMQEKGLMPFWVTPRVAKWIARLRRWIPDLEGAGAYVLPAWWYAAREARGASTADLDEKMAEIAARRWRKKESDE
jgi:hypothetical protein